MNDRALYEIETSLWTNDPLVYRQALRDDALLVFQETGVITRDAAVAAIVEENREGRRWAEVTFADQRVLAPTSDSRVLIYRAAARWNIDAAPMTVLCTSTYAKRGDDWLLVVHQQTPIIASATY